VSISRLGSFDMMSAYNRIDNSQRSVNTVNAVNPETKVNESVNEIKPVASEPKEEPQELKVNLNLEGMRRRSAFSFDDISRDFSKRELFSINSVDENTMQSKMQKAVSEMEEDSSIQQYQYFVGNSNVILDNEDGTVIMK